MKTSLSALNAKNLATLAVRVIAVSSKPEYETLVKTHPLLLSLQEEYTVYDAVYLKQTYSGMGKEVADADERRDIYFRGLRNIVAGYALLTGNSLQPDAAKLYDIIEQVGANLNRLSYSEETARMRKLVEEFEKSENIEHVKKLYLTEVVASLTLAQQQFESVFAIQTQANALLRQKQSASSIRKELESALRNYLNMITALRHVPVWKPLYGELNELTKAAAGSTTPNFGSVPPVPAS